MHTLSFGELAIIFGIIIMLFGGSRIATIGKSLGEGIANFKKGLNTPVEDKPQTPMAVQQEPKVQVVHNVQIDSQQETTRYQHVVDVKEKLPS